MRKLIFPLLLILSIFLTAFAQAPSSDLRISHMEIDIWPEYDQQSVLVIFRISLTSTANLPARISLRIPASAGNPYSVAMKDLDGMLYDLEYSITPDGSWNKIDFVTSSQDVQIEFYDPYYFKQSFTVRGYDFAWISDYPVDDLAISIQQPKYAKSMTVEPDAGAGVVNSDDGLTYFSLPLGSIERGSVVNVIISYIKVADGLSASTVPVRPVSQLPKQKTLWQTISSVLHSIWGNTSLMVTGSLLLGALILFAALLVIMRGSPTAATKKKQSLAKRKTQPASEENKEIFCYQCGKRARTGDVYCRTCGSKLIE